MKISTTLEQMINDQINLEFESKFAYLGIASWLETTPFSGFAQWMRIQSDEENEHAMKFYDYLNDRFGEVQLKPLSASPKCSFSSVLEAFEAALAHEQKVTKSIHELYNQAKVEPDHETHDFLSWFLQEQIEEEKSVQDMIDKLKFVDNNPSYLLILDKEAQQRQSP